MAGGAETINGLGFSEYQRNGHLVNILVIFLIDGVDGDLNFLDSLELV